MIEIQKMIDDVNVETHSLHVDHYREGCDCHPHTVVQTTVKGKDFNISVPSCTAGINRSPLRDACDSLSKFTGYEIIRKEVAESYVHEYTNGPVGYLFEDVLPVVYGTFGNDYYLKRDVLEFCSRSSFRRELCKICGYRQCENIEFCNENNPDIDRIYREYKGSYVYFLFHPSTTLVKVGTSIDPTKRIKAHISANAGEIQILGIIRGSDSLERSIHHELEQWRAAGKKEWFYYTESVARYIARIISCVENLE